jgi:rhamnogalacturonan endolyase
MERLDRGVVAAKIGSSNNAFISWRLFATDPAGVAFNVYRNSETAPVNPNPLDAAHTNYTVSGGAASGTAYSVAVIVNGVETERSKAATVLQTSVNNNGAYLEIPVQRPVAGTGPQGGAYEIYDGTVADLDGDGEYEIIFFWVPNNMKDNSQSGITDNVYIDAYKLNGTKLWGSGKWINLGPNIRAGAHYQLFLVYDFDGNGKAEIIVKTADGTTDADGTRIGTTATHRNSDGYILTGDEYISVFEGATGKLIDSKPFKVARGSVNDWGDNYGNRVDRFLGAVAYLDGVRPSAVIWRGYYARTTASAWDFDGKTLTNRWVFDTRGMTGGSAYQDRGNHNLSVAEADGADIIITGSLGLNSDGTPRYQNGTSHGDAMHVSKHIPGREGLQVFRCIESSPFGVQMYDASTGKIIWNVTRDSDTGRALCADIDPEHPGNECWGAGIDIHSAEGARLSGQPSNLSNNMAIWWDGDTGRETWDGTVVKVNAGAGSGSNLRTYSRQELLTHSGAATIGGTKKNPVLQADILGDWREEVILPSANHNALRIYTTTMATTHAGAGKVPSQGIPALMHNKMYRLAIAWQNSAYNMPPWTDYFLGYNMGEVPRDNIIYAGSASSSSSAAPSSSSAAKSSSSATLPFSSSSSEKASSSSSEEILSSSSGSAEISSSGAEISAIYTPPFGHPSNRGELSNAASHLPLTTYYNLKGEPLGAQMPQTPGVYIEKKGESARKIFVNMR